jgi:hypothetical protein
MSIDYSHALWLAAPVIVTAAALAYSCTILSKRGAERICAAIASACLFLVPLLHVVVLSGFSPYFVWNSIEQVPVQRLYWVFFAVDALATLVCVGLLLSKLVSAGARSRQ